MTMTMQTSTTLDQIEGETARRGTQAARATLNRCQFCGDPIPQGQDVQGHGGRKWCSERCRRDHRTFDRIGPDENWEWSGDFTGDRGA